MHAAQQGSLPLALLDVSPQDGAIRFGLGLTQGSTGRCGGWSVMSKNESTLDGSSPVAGQSSVLLTDITHRAGMVLSTIQPWLRMPEVGTITER